MRHCGKRISQYKSGQSGFTVHELLIVIAVSVILLAVSIVGIVTYMRQLQLAELDNAAKEIFLSAQNRAILLSSNQRLKNSVVHSGDTNQIENVDVIPDSDETTQITVYYIHSDDENIDKLLPQETIDPTLWDGDFYIVYEPESASVVDVFFTDGEALPVGDGFPAFYRMWRAAPKEDRMDSRPMIGYYGGESAQSGTTLSLRTPVINIYNEDTLRVEVTYWVPQTLIVMGESENVEMNVDLTYGIQQPIRLEKMKAKETINIDPAYRAYTYTWTLDSWNGAQHFYELFSSSNPWLQFGGDFTVSAEVSYIGETLKVNGARKTAQDNSLFGTGSGGDTAYITCLRHLQNLDEAFSKVGGKTAAVQRRDIMNVENYSFDPIENENLQSYDGQEYSIYDLQITSAGAQSCGLFGRFSGAVDNYKQLSNIRLVNTKVTNYGSGATGVLVGRGENLTLDGCQVYWENRSEQTTNLREMLGNSETGFYYQVTGSGAIGGLAGSLAGSTVSNCSASTLVSGKDDLSTVGGLVGEGYGLTVTNSYAASYLQGNSAAGLIGNTIGNVSLSACYAVGFIDSTDSNATAAGLSLGNSTHVENSYSAMLFTAGNTVTNYPLCETGNYDNTCYLASNQFGFNKDTQYAKSYADLTNPAQWSTLFDSGTFAAKSTVQSHPYNLQTTLSLTAFIYPGLANMEHWGDWGAQFQNGSLVYYEKYKDKSYGFSGGDVSHLEDDQLVIEDGYAVAYRGTPFTSSIGVTLKVTYQTSVSPTNTWEKTYYEEEMYCIQDVSDTDGQKSDYYLLPLPSEVVNTDYVAENFYQKITIEDDGHQSTRNYYYNPHFANSVLREENGENPVTDVHQLRVIVRSPRHLYMLSKYEAYHASANQYRFLQQLNLDYRSYNAYELFTKTDWTQNPIGLNADDPFRGSYYGNCHTIRGVQLATQDSKANKYTYVGLFGYSTGVLQDVVYRMTRSVSVTQRGSSSAVLYVGGLAGYNGGTISNCVVTDVQLQSSGFDYSTIYLGGLVGLNAGYIHACEAEAQNIQASATYSDAYAGGFIGLNAAGGTIDQCYAVGKVTVSRARYGTVMVCGFAAGNNGILRRSYAAAFLTASGEAERFGFCPDTSTGCVYLNAGNFTYRDENYTAQYEDLYAMPVTWTQLTGAESAAAVKGLGMSEQSVVAVDDTTQGYPYPGIVTDGADKVVHYGQWPTQMPLGQMGVYYWEKMTIGNTPSYHFSVISTDGSAVYKSSTLSTEHGDGGVVSEYGYGYFYAGTQAPILTSSGIGFQSDGNFYFQSEAENQDANTALSALMSGQYTFHSYSTWETVAEDQGLYTSATRDGQPPYGTWTLKRGNDELMVCFNPFFADAMSIASSERAQINVPTNLPGTSKNPYQVRSIDQLQFINWNDVDRNTICRMDTENMETFPYLCYGTGGNWTVRAFYWDQTHDLEGETGETYTPIAGVYDEKFTKQSGGDLFGWFGGTYDGNDYMISDVNIAPASSADDDWMDGEFNDSTSCVGLFGAVYNGKLQNIVLYSADGNATVSGTNSGTSQWYVVGGLAGLAGSSTGSAVVNCTVSGYTIQDKHHSKVQENGWGGTGVGGLIGICDMDLVGCTAVTKLEIDSRNQDNVRIGGLVGSCQGSISSCYTGGSIGITSGTSTPNGIYIGGIVGGIYMKPLQVGGREQYTVGDRAETAGGEPLLNNSLANCYTYTELPDAGINGLIKGLYAIGGSGELNPKGTNDNVWDHGSTSYDNNYYLESVVLKNNQNGQVKKIRNDLDYVTAMTYTEMADTQSDSGLLRKLNAKADANAKFSTVTTETVNGEPLNGRYSFGNDSSLLGWDYPFPTILKQASNMVDGGMANVHYGDWPLEGIVRPEGALPVDLDLFANYNTDAKDAVKVEHLTLSKGVDTGGNWRAVSSAPEVATVQITENGQLTITAKAAGNTVVTVFYKVNGKDYTPLNIEVNVTAELHLVASKPPVTALAGGAQLSTVLLLRNRDGKPLSDDLQGKIQLTNFTVEHDPDYFTLAEVGNSISTDNPTLTAVSTDRVGQSQMTVGYDFTYQGKTYHTTSVLNMETKQAQVKLTPVMFAFASDAVDAQTKNYTGEGFTLLLAGSADSEQVANLRIVGYELDTILHQTLLVGWAKDQNGNEIPATLSITAYPQRNYPAIASVRVQYQFDWEGSTHTMWQDLSVNITNAVSGAEDAVSGAEDNQEMPAVTQPDALLPDESEQAQSEAPAEDAQTEEVPQVEPALPAEESTEKAEQTAGEAAQS